nr:lipoate--protein ligase [Desulfonispora thiosulfatigenes]
MLYIINKNTNPYYNLACEEYLLKNFNEPIFMLWQNEPCVVVGKNQNTISELNLDYINEHAIPVVRRLTGGGAVFHDLGNINFTFIIDNDHKSFSNFKKFTEPIIEVLQDLGIDAQFSGRNDLTIEGKKFSGNAQFQDKFKVMHHGTLLFNSKVQDIVKALKPKTEKYVNTGVKSVQSRVTTISEYLQESLSIDDFQDLVLQKVLSTSNNTRTYQFSLQEIENIKKLVQEKYNTWDWNFGASPKYNFTNTLKYAGGLIEVYLQVEKGIIKNIKFYGDFFGVKDIGELENAFLNQKHETHTLERVIDNYHITEFFLNLEKDKLLTLLFK